MFLCVSVILSTGGGVLCVMSLPVAPSGGRGLCPGGSLSRAISVHRSLWSEESLSESEKRALGFLLECFLVRDNCCLIAHLKLPSPIR